MLLQNWLAKDGLMYPEAAVHEDGNASTRKADVRLARGLLPMQAVAGVAGLAQPGAHEQLGLGVLALVRLHHMARGLTRQNDAAPPTRAGRPQGQAPPQS